VSRGSEMSRDTSDLGPKCPVSDGTHGEIASRSVQMEASFGERGIKCLIMLLFNSSKTFLELCSKGLSTLVPENGNKTACFPIQSCCFRKQVWTGLDNSPLSSPPNRFRSDSDPVSINKLEGSLERCSKSKHHANYIPVSKTRTLIASDRLILPNLFCGHNSSAVLPILHTFSSNHDMLLLPK